METPVFKDHKDNVDEKKLERGIPEAEWTNGVVLAGSLQTHMHKLMKCPFPD